MFGIPDLAFGAILAALIAGGVSLLSLVITKENKTSEFRQAWVDALRADTTSLISEFRIYALHRQFGGHPTAVEGLLNVRAGQTVVRLRLNPSEDTTPKVLKQIEAMDDLLRRGDFEEAHVDAVALGLEQAVQPILKANWDKVRDGEPWFRRTRWAAILTIGAGVGLLVWRALLPPPESAPRAAMQQSAPTSSAPRSALPVTTSPAATAK